MSNHNIASLIRNFFEQHLAAERGLSPHTILAYRDTMKLLIQFSSTHLKKDCFDLSIENLGADVVKAFLNHLEQVRHNTIRTRNARLAAIHAFFRYVGGTDPRLMEISRAILFISFKRQICPVLGYLDREEVTHIFQNMESQKCRRRRDEALLRILYNTGARSQEIVSLDINHVRFVRPYSVLIHGKGHRERTCPLWPETVSVLKGYLEERQVRFSDRVPLFVNTKGNRLSRFGLRYIIAHWVGVAAQTAPTLLKRKISPHTFRHTTAMHLLQSGVDLNMIRSWLGHSSIDTTHGYVELDLEMKRKTLQSCQKFLPKSNKRGPSWQKSPDILAWLEKL
jgi:site-specific recombinase XerD